MSRRVLAVGIALALAAPPALLLVMGCKEPAAPGTQVGIFQMEGTLTENTCGEALGPPAALAFAAELRRNGPTAYWRMGTEGPRVEGTIDADGDFRFRQQQSFDGWAADPANGIPACRFLQTETIAGHVELIADDGDAGVDDGGIDGMDDAGVGDGGDGDAGIVHARVMSATNVIEVAQVPGFDCSLALVSSGAGGQFPSLPCRASYTLEGATRE